MSIWFNKTLKKEDLVSLQQQTMSSCLGMEYIEIGSDHLLMRMPVDERTKQPYGLLHGGASCALAETIGSVASHLVIDSAKKMAVGLEINANHIRSVKTGWVYARCRPLHLGAATHVWDIRITDDRDKLVCVSRLTVAIIDRR
jgi:1,4-dihydroxy-2-naphthoyl-CoA hydrolase